MAEARDAVGTNLSGAALSSFLRRMAMTPETLGPQGLALSEVLIDGDLVLGDVSWPRPLVLVRCRVAGGIYVHGATLRSLDLDGCEVEDGFGLYDTDVSGDVGLPGGSAVQVGQARIGGGLRLPPTAWSTRPRATARC